MSGNGPCRFTSLFFVRKVTIMRIFLITALLTLLAVAACQPASENATNESTANAPGAGSRTSGAADGQGDDLNEADSEANDSKPNFEKSGIQSEYTDLAENKCEDVDIDEEESWSVQSCDGVGGYQLLVSEGDLRQTIDIIAPNERKYELNFWTVVSGAFSTVGDKAEWRVKKVDGRVRPVALIVRYNVSENPENADEVTSYLTVSKITDTAACVTDVVKPVKNANQIARDLADAASDKPCLKKRK